MKLYVKFAAMIVTSTIVMFGLMYLNTYSAEHIFFSETRFYMAFVMGATMAVIMLLFMLNMYKNWKVNAAILSRQRGRFRRRVMACAKPGNRRGCFVDEGDDPASLDSDFDQRTRPYHRPARAETCRRHY